MHLLLLNVFQRVWDFVLYSSSTKRPQTVSITAGDVFMFIFWVVLFYILILVLLKKVLRRTFRQLTSGNIDHVAIANTTALIIFIIAFLVLLSYHGIDLTALGIFGGLLGVGIGFGLQNITNNFISGIIIFLEKPIKRGDRIQMDDLEGNIKRISLRSTSVRTNDNFTIIVPNSYFLQNKIINWSHSELKVRLSVSIGIGYQEDLDMVRNLMLQIADEHTQVLKKPAPDVIFESVGASALNFTLRVWTEKFISTPKVLRSELYFAMYTRLRSNNIEMSYPQLDIWIRDKWVKDFFKKGDNPAEDPQK